MEIKIDGIFLNKLREAIKANDKVFIKSQVEKLHAADIAEIFNEIDTEEELFIYKLLSEEEAADVILELNDEVRERLLASLSSKEIAEQIIDNIDSDDAADVISELSEEQQGEVLSHMEDVEQASDIAHLLNYAEDTAGGLMATELISVNLNWTVEECVVEIRKQAEAVKNIYTIYVVDDTQKLMGIVSLKDMIISPVKTLVKDIYESEIISVNISKPNEEIARIMEKYDLVVLPVTDTMGRLVGRITIDDVVDVIKDEADKDIQMMSGISEDVEDSDTIFTITRARLPWLLIGMIGGIMSAKVVGIFDLSKHIQMVFFMPLIAGTAGNVGVQSSAIIVQSLANKTLDTSNIISRLMKEFLVGLLNATICSLVILSVNLVFGYDKMLSVTVCIALFSVIILAALLGTFVPLILNKYKIDPAIATGPFVTTSNDIFGLLLYFGIGNLLLN